MFLLECATDNSLLIKRNESVICDHKTVACGNVVAFYHRKKKYNGTVRMISTDEDVLCQEIEKIKSADKKKIRSSGTKPIENIDKIQSSKRKLNKSKNEPQPKKIKGKLNETRDSVTQDKYKDDDDDTDVASEDSENSLPSDQIDRASKSQRFAEGDGHGSDGNFSPGRPPLKDIVTTPKSSRPSAGRVLLPQTPNRQQLFIYNGQDSNISGMNLEDDDDDDDDDDKAQLYGNSETEKMKHIGNGIYCKLANYKNGVKGTPSATALARNLLVGVFKREALIKSSVAGRSPRAQGAERMKQENLRLNDRATKTIIKFATDYAQKKHWKGEVNDSKIKSALAQKIVEVKGEEAKNSSQP